MEVTGHCTRWALRLRKRILTKMGRSLVGPRIRFESCRK